VTKSRQGRYLMLRVRAARDWRPKISRTGQKSDACSLPSRNAHRTERAVKYVKVPIRVSRLSAETPISPMRRAALVLTVLRNAIAVSR